MPLYLNGKKVDNIDQAIISEDGWIGIGAALERIVFDGSGNDISVLGANLGVGVSDPGARLQVLSSITAYGVPSTTYTATLSRAHTLLGSAASGTGLLMGLGTTDYTWLQAQHTDNSAKHIVLNAIGGNVGIGTTGPLDPLTVLATSTVGSETLTETAFTTHANWDVTGDFLDTGGNAAYTHATGVGTLTQQSANFAIPVKPGRYYKFAYTVSGVTAGCTANITTAVASATTALTLNNGAQTTYFKSAAAPGNFVISATSTAGAFTLDNVTLKEVQGGAGNFGGGLTALSGTFEASDNGTAITARINAAQASVDAGDTFIDFRSTTGSEGTIAGTAVAGVLAYNTFTGSHYTQVVDRVGLEIGMVLEIVDGTPVFEPQLNEAEHTIQVDEPVLDDEGNSVIEDVPVLDDEGNPKTESKSKTKKVEQVVPATYYVASPKPQLWKSQICKTQGSKAAIGVWIGTDREGRDMVASIGTGVIWLANTGKSLTVGDYLVSSDIAGCAELQTDDIYRSSTIAKLVEGIVWQPGEVTRLVKCIYLGG